MLSSEVWWVPPVADGSHAPAYRRMSERFGARFVRIDVTDDASVAAAAADIADHEGSIDVWSTTLASTAPPVTPPP